MLRCTCDRSESKETEVQKVNTNRNGCNITVQSKTVIQFLFVPKAERNLFATTAHS